MSFIQKTAWPDFHAEGLIYTLDHLNEYMWQLEDTQGNSHRSIVTFTDHCFTREAVDGDDPAYVYPNATRRNGYFCKDRYRHSLFIREHLEQAKHVWLMSEDLQYALIPTVDHDGVQILYGVIFTLSRIKGLPAPLHFRVKSAYPCLDQRRPIATYGRIRLPFLVSNALEGRRPKKNYDQGRQRPKLP